jgi:hypothetical protein
VNYKTGRVARSADLREANPELALFLASARPSFTDRFVAVAPDDSHAYAFSADTLKASACAPPARGTWLDEQRNARIEASLCSGGLIAADQWLAVATPEAGASDYKPGFSLPRDFSAETKDRALVLYRGTCEANDARHAIRSVERVGESRYRGATFLRAAPGAAILRAAAPDSVFLLHRAGSQLFAPLTLVRLAPDGRVVWSADTGIGRLTQVLPGANDIALLGERPPAPNKVPEPIMTLIDTQRGAPKITSLWR